MSGFVGTVSWTSVHPGPYGGGVVVGEVSTGRVRCIARAGVLSRLPLVGEAWTITGTVEHHPDFGPQVQIASGRPVPIQGRLLKAFLVRHPAIRGIGIGSAAADRLFEAFGTDCARLLGAGDVGELGTVLSGATAKALVEAWGKLAVEASVFDWLELHEFDLHLASKVIRLWPDDTVAKLTESPYRMLALAPWTKVDAAARRIGVAADDDRRLVAAVEASLYARYADKHTATPEPQLMAAAAKFLGSAMHVPRALRLAGQQRAYAICDTGLQPIGAAFMEAVVERRFRELASTQVDGDMFSDQAERAVAGAVQALPFQPTEEQVAAVAMALGNRLSVISGSAGVGKTAVTKMLHAAAASLGRPILQMALAGKAAKRLADATDRKAYTIARALRDSGLWTAGVRTLILLDESSMVDLPTIYRLVEMMPADASLVMVGDSAQLGPIGPGLVFHVAAESARVPRTTLTIVQRQAATSGIPAIAAEVRAGRVPAFTEMGDHGVSFIECGPDEIRERVLEMKDRFEDAQILCATNQGAVGVDPLNELYHSRHAESHPSHPSWPFCVGEPVIYGDNDMALELSNGSMGRIVAIEAWGVTVDFGTDGVVDLDLDHLEHLAHAYAITIHRAQGSSSPRVIVPIVQTRLNDRALIYTAITRAERQCILVGDRQALEAAICCAPDASRRQVGISFD